MDNTSKNTMLTVQPCGDGLYFFGGDLFCIYKLLGVEITESSVQFEYEKYYVFVSWENNGKGIRENPKWERIYKHTGEVI